MHREVGWLRHAKRAAHAVALGAAALLVLLLPLAGRSAAGAAAPAATCALTTSQLASIRSEILTALTTIELPLASAARTKAISTALAQIAQSEAIAIGPCSVSVIVADAIAAGVAPTTAVDGVIIGSVAGGIPRSLAIADAVEGAVGVGASAADVTAQAIATANKLGVPPNVTGVGLGTAAAAIGATNLAAARGIAQTIANEGSEEMRVAFQSTLKSSGAPETVLVVGNVFPLASGEIGEGREIGDATNNNQGGNRNQGNDSGDQGNANNQQANTNQNLPPCSGPSCS